MIEMSTFDGVIARASERLGYSTLRPNQYKAIKDVFVTLPMGSGNLCHLAICF